MNPTERAVFIIGDQDLDLPGFMALCRGEAVATVGPDY